MYGVRRCNAPRCEALAWNALRRRFFVEAVPGCFRAVHQLDLREVTVQAVLAQQRVVTALGDGTALVEDDDAIRDGSGRQTVGGDEDGAAPLERSQGAADGLLALRVEGTGRLVHQQDLR